jgi:hypothetical protein
MLLYCPFYYLDTLAASDKINLKKTFGFFQKLLKKALTYSA